MKKAFLIAMKKNISNSRYETVNELPANALTVAQYAANQNYSTNYVYNQVRDAEKKGKQIDFKIVVFNTINFVIPSL